MPIKNSKNSISVEKPLKRYWVKFLAFPEGKGDPVADYKKHMIGSFEVWATSEYAAKRKVIDLFRPEIVDDGDGVDFIKIEEI